MVDHSLMRLGRVEPTQPHGLLRLAKYTQRAALPPAPSVVDWTNGTADDSWGMAGNDMAGDCVLAGIAHALHCMERWRDGAGRAVATPEVLNNYRTFGYAPPESDPGCNMAQVMRTWVKDGLLWQGQVDKAEAVVEVRFGNLPQALALFGPILLGVKLPRSAATQELWRSPQTLVGDDNVPGGWGGHCVMLAGAMPGFVKLITWGGVKIAEQGWLEAYFAEAWALLHPIWKGTGRTPNGSLVGDLLSDMALVG